MSCWSWRNLCVRSSFSALWLARREAHESVLLKLEEPVCLFFFLGLWRHYHHPARRAASIEREAESLRFPFPCFHTDA